MSGRVFFGWSRNVSTLSLVVACVGLCSASAQGQGVADTPQAPIAPAEPPVAPPAPDPPAPTPSEPAPPNQAPPITEPTPAPTLAPEQTPARPSEGAPKSESPASAAFAPLPGMTREVAKPQPMPAASPSAQAGVATPASPPAPPPAEPRPKDDEDFTGLLGPFRIGVLVGTGLPEVLNFGAQLKLTRYFGAGVNVGLIPTVRINYYGEASQKYQEYDAYGHIYPFGGSFFLGAGVGYAQIDGTLVTRFNLADIPQAAQAGLSGSVSATSDASVRTLVLTPQLGFLKIFEVGFAIGFDVGAQIPIAPSEVRFSTVAPTIPGVAADTIQTKYINPNDEKVRSTLNTLGRTPLPTFNFKIGWFL